MDTVNVRKGNFHTIMVLLVFSLLVRTAADYSKPYHSNPIIAKNTIVQRELISGNPRLKLAISHPTFYPIKDRSAHTIPCPPVASRGQCDTSSINYFIVIFQFPSNILLLLLDGG